MSSARDEILARIHAARPAVVPDIPRAYHGVADTRLANPPGMFEERLRDYGAQVRRCSRESVADTVRLTLTDRGIRRLVVPTGFPASWSPTGTGYVLVDDEPVPSVFDLDAVDGVLTSCAVAVATTGTIVLDAGPGQGRRALTLLPDYHLVVVREDQLVNSVPDALAWLNPRRPLTWISGPSATSDIELNRVEGVHGPRTLEVILVGGS